MANNYRQEGGTLSFTNLTAAAISSSHALVFGLIGLAVALVDIAINATGSVAMEGVWQFTKSSGAIAQGDKLWWSPTAETVTNSPTLNSYFIGYASEAALTGDTVVNVLLEEFSNEGTRVLTMSATGSQTLKAGDMMGGDLVLLVPNTAAKTIVLPSVDDIPLAAKLTVKKTTADAFAVTLDGSGSETIDGNATYTAIDANGDYALFINNGSAWIKLNAVIA